MNGDSPKLDCTGDINLSISIKFESFPNEKIYPQISWMIIAQAKDFLDRLIQIHNGRNHV